MTAIRKHDAAGRSSGAMKVGRLSKIAGQFIAHRVEMRASPAWRALSFDARRVLDRLELEHAAHAGRENGSLPCTYADFVEWGCRRESISDAIRELVALGFVEVTRQGRAGNREFRTPSLYRLTYVQGNLVATDEWRDRAMSLEEAQAIADGAHLKRARARVRRSTGRLEIQNFGGGGAPRFGGGGAPTGR